MPVGGATGVQYTRRSTDWKVQRRELDSIWEREVDFGQVLTYHAIRNDAVDSLAIILRTRGLSI